VEILQRLIVLATQLAELASRQAHEEATAPPPEQASKQPRRPAYADPKIIFLRLRRAIQETIAFKNRLAAALQFEARYQAREPAPNAKPEPAIITEAPEPAATPAPNPPDDPRRPHIARYFREGIDITAKKRKTPLTLHDVDKAIDAELAKDPDRRLQGRVILLKVCKSLDLPFYATRMRTELYRPPQALASPPP
jgi:hypothetical protein